MRENIKKWKSLTQPELHGLSPSWPMPNQRWKFKDVRKFVKAIEEKLKEKNGYNTDKTL